MKIYELKINDVIDDGETIIKVLHIYNDEATIFINGPDTYRIVRGPTDAIIKHINMIVNTQHDFNSYNEYRKIQDEYWSSNHSEIRLVSARPEDQDFNPMAKYCEHDTEYMLDAETGELYDL